MQLRYLPDVVTLTVDAEKCTGCGMCIEVCPHGVLALSDGKAAIADRDACMECGACAMNCVPEAITVQSGVGCATAVIAGLIRGTQPVCDCGTDPTCCE